MKIVKAWASRIWAGLDGVVAELEDHDALVESALRELEHAGKRTRRELEGVRAHGAGLRNRRALERESIDTWRTAAAREDDDAEAVELLRRARRAATREAQLHERLEEHARAERRLADQAASLAERIEALKRRQHLMRTRTAQVEAREAVPVEIAPVEEVFERWDVSLTRAEHLADADAFSELEREEEERTLLVELAELRRGDAG